MVDPPEGWRYGFPKKFDITPGETFAQWLVRRGYPESMLDLALMHSRWWDE